MQVRWTDTALSELDAIIAYIDAESPASAQAVLMRIESQTTLLGDFPLLGHATDEPETRVLSVVRYPFLIFYTIDDAANDVVILHVRHSAQRPFGG